MLQKMKSLNWPAIVAALAALGIITTADARLAAISIAGMLIVTLLNFLARSFNYRIGAGWLSIGLYVVSTILAVLLEPFNLPSLPVYPGDPVTFAQAVAEFIARTAPLAGSITASATLIYNALKPLVWDKVLPIVDEIGDSYGEAVG